MSNLTLTELIIWHQNQVDMSAFKNSVATHFHIATIELLQHQQALNDIMTIHFRLLTQWTKQDTIEETKS